MNFSDFWHSLPSISFIATQFEAALEQTIPLETLISFVLASGIGWFLFGLRYGIDIATNGTLDRLEARLQATYVRLAARFRSLRE